MTALSMISMIVIDTVSVARAIGTMAVMVSPACTSETEVRM